MIVVDIDGTIADNIHRQHLAPRGAGSNGDDASWFPFHWASERDLPVRHTVELVTALRNSGAEVLFLTARKEWMRDHTDHWLRANVFSDYGYTLLMRPKDDDRKASDVKMTLLRDLFDSMRK